MRFADKNEVVLGLVCWYVNIFVMYSREYFCYIGVFDLRKTFIRFKIKTPQLLLALTVNQCLLVLVYSFSCIVLNGIRKNFKVIIPIYGAWFTVLGTFAKDLTERFV